MNFEQNGFELVPNVIAPERRDSLIAALKDWAPDGPGSRDLLDAPWCQDLAGDLRGHPRLASLLPAAATAVQCTYFHKSASLNWLVSYHQDLAIPVRARIDAPSWSGWSIKQGVPFVQPPTSVLEALTAVRVHLDPNDEDNGPLRVIPGSHACGRLDPEAIRAARADRPEFLCTAPERSALAFRPLLLHASSKSRTAKPRRVLHFLFGPPNLPDGLEWRLAV